MALTKQSGMLFLHLGTAQLIMNQSWQELQSGQSSFIIRGSDQGWPAHTLIIAGTMLLAVAACGNFPALFARFAAVKRLQVISFPADKAGTENDTTRRLVPCEPAFLFYQISMQNNGCGSESARSGKDNLSGLSHHLKDQIAAIAGRLRACKRHEFLSRQARPRQPAF